MSEKPLPFSNGLQLKSMGAVLLLVLGVLIWRLTDATTTTARVLYIAAIAFEVLFFAGLVFASRTIKKQYARAEDKYQAQVAAKKQAEATGVPADTEPAAPEPAAPQPVAPEPAKSAESPRDTAEETDTK